MSASYPLDLTGVNPLNLIPNELHTVSEAQFRDYYFIVPNLSPFFVDNFSLKLSLNNVDTPLVEDVDFSFALPYIAGTRSTGKQMYGAVTLHNLNANGILKMTYQTVGGNQVADRLYVLSVLADKAYNPRTTVFDTIIGLPNAFPPTPHYQDYDNFYGQEQVVNGLDEIAGAIAQNAGLTSQVIYDFLNEFNSGGSSYYVNKTGGSMQGPLYLSTSPSADLEAATKGYVDQKVAAFANMAQILSGYVTDATMIGALSEKISKTGDVMSGPLILQTPAFENEHAVNKLYVDTKILELNAALSTRINELSDGR